MLLAAFALVWRLCGGASVLDDGYVVALALRIARGDLPLADEQPLMSLGALPAVPGVWLWDHVVGTEGLVLASRVMYAVAALGVAAVAYRGLRTTFSRAASLAGVGAALFAIPYQVAAISYASVPVFVVIIGTAAGVALLRRPSAAWAVTLGGSAAVGAWLVPHLAPAFVVMVAVWLVLTRSPRLLLWGFGAAAAVSVVAATLLVAVVGVDGIRAAVDFTLSLRSDMTPLERVVRAAGTYRMFAQTGYLPVALCLLATAIAGVRASWRPARVAFSALACLAAAALSAASVAVGQPVVWFGTTASALTSVLVIVLAVAVTGELVHVHQRGGIALAAAAVATGGVASLLTAATTASGPHYSAHGGVLAGALMVLAAMWVRMAAEVSPRLAVVAAAVPVTCIASAWWVQPFGDAPIWQLDTRIASGPWSGLLTTRERAADLEWLQSVVEQHAEPQQGVLFIGFPGGYLIGHQRMDTNTLFITPEYDQGAATVAWLERTGRRPSLVVAAPFETDSSAGQPDDPLRRWVTEHYTPAVVEARGSVWLLQHQ